MAQIVKNFQLEDLDSELLRIKAFLKSKLTVKRFACVFDEAQAMLQLGHGKFQSKSQVENRPVYSAVSNSILFLFGDRRDSNFDTMFWASGTGLSISEAQKLVLSQIARISGTFIVKFHTIKNILKNGEVHDYIKEFIPEDVEKINEEDLDLFAGRRRFAASLAEHILTHRELECISHVKRLILHQLGKCWNSIRHKISTPRLSEVLSMTNQFVLAYVFSGRPLYINTTNIDQQRELIHLFEYGIGIVEGIVELIEGPWISISLKEPLVMISADSVFGITEKVMNFGPNTPLSSMGFTWEHCVAKALVQHAEKNEGKINISAAFGIDLPVLEKHGVASELLLKDYNNLTIFEKNSISSRLYDKTEVPLVSPSYYAGPDAVCKLGDFPAFIQMKFREKISLGNALLAVTPSQFYKEKDGHVPGRFKRELNSIQTFMGGKKTVIRIIICYPYTVRNGWDNHYRVVQARKTRSNPNPIEYIDFLVDGNNARSFFGDEQVDRFDRVLKQAAEYVPMEDGLIEDDTIEDIGSTMDLDDKAL